MAKGKLHRIEHKVHDDKSVSYEIAREHSGKAQKGPFLSEREYESGTHKTAKEAGDHLRKVLREAGVKDGE